ncbi:MAG TPA: hypothetical protein VGB15_14595 [Longimicrobium sp.]|jgi:hypothetical protein
MIRKLIVPAALLALSACAGSPTEPALRTGASRADAHPAFGSGVGLLPPTDASSGTAAADASGYIGSGNLEEPVDAPPQIGSGAAADGGYLGSGN